MLSKLLNDLVMFVARVRTYAFSYLLGEVGENVIIMDHCRFYSPAQIKIGANTFINNNCRLSGMGGLEVGENVMFGHNVSIYSSSHNIDDLTIPMKDQGQFCKKVKIADDVWLGANSVILPGVIVGKGAVIGANSVVTKSVPKYSVVGGVPAKLIRMRNAKK